jgi:tetratricopeptide (TPR) repeat protein
MKVRMVHPPVRRLVVLAALVAVAGCSRWDARMELRRGNQSYNEQKYDEALLHYANIPDGTHERIHAALNSGYAHMAQYRFGSKHPRDLEHAAKAVGYFDEYLRLLPQKELDQDLAEPGKVEEYIITLLADAGHYRAAVERLELQLQKKPNDPAILRAIATTYDTAAKPVKALEYFNKWAGLYQDNPSPWSAIAAYCWNMSYRVGPNLDVLSRNRYVDMGLEAADRALQIRPEMVEALTYKNLLLRERAKVRTDPDRVGELLAEAVTLMERAQELRKKEQEAEEAAKAAAAAAGTTPGAAGNR